MSKRFAVDRDGFSEAHATPEGRIHLDLWQGRDEWPSPEEPQVKMFSMAPGQALGLARDLIDAALRVSDEMQTKPVRAGEPTQQTEEAAFALGWIPAEGDTSAPVSQVYLADCRKCERRVIAWLRGDQGEYGWGYMPIGKCGRPDRCGELQPVGDDGEC